ncbi:MAG TPA: S8 family peptidase, partial [Candidatus Eisenbacteria bacterium]|nr:S8 family peptidase [Candidatus Eisenbacteria bacterium]
MVRLVHPSLLRLLHPWLRGALAVAFAALIAGVLSVPRPVSAAPPGMVPGEVLVRFKATASRSDIRAVMNELGATRVRRFQKIRAEHHRITRLSVEDAVHRFRNHRAVEIIEPNWIVQADDVPNDPQFDLLWGLRNTGQTGGLAGADIDAVPAWDVQTGSRDVVVAVIDTGTDYDHPDLAGNIWTNTGEVPDNLIDDDGNGYVDDVHGYDFHNEDGDPMDDNGHGTHVSGTIGAVGNNGVGMTGVARDVRIMALKFLGGNGSGATSDAVASVEYAIQMGAHVMNSSWGGSNFSALLQLAIENANAAGISFVAAAGNSGISLDSFRHYPASYPVPNVIAVASTTHHDILSPFSNFGATTVHLAAPGSSIWSTLPGSSYGHISGTSMATPHVAGAIALLRSEFPNMAASQIKTTVLS